MRSPSLSFTAVFTAALLAGASSGRAAIIGIEPFAYTNGIIAGKSSGTYWDLKNVSPVLHTGVPSDWNNVFGTPLVSAGRLVTDNNSVLREYNANESDGAVNELNVSKQVYYRVTLTTGATLPDYFGLSSYDFATERVFFGKRFGQPYFGMEAPDDGILTNSPVPVAANTTYLLVARLDYDDNLIRLYVNPDLGQPEPATATVSASYGNTFWSTAVRLASGAGGAVTWGDLVVANEWENLRSLVTTAADEDNGSFGGGTGVSLREAVKYSLNGARVVFTPGLNGATITLTNEIVIGNNVTIDAFPLANGIRISGNNATRVFRVSGGAVAALNGLRIVNGQSSGGAYGGAIFVTGSQLTLNNCTLSGNRVLGATAGGAIATASGSIVTLTGCTLYSNRTDTFGGGAIFNQDCVLTLNSCTFSDNFAADYGGALQNWFSSTSIVRNCSLIANSAVTEGGGFYDLGYSSMENSVVASNSAPVEPNISGSIEVLAGNNFTNGNPMLAPLGNYGGPTPTRPPLPGSPLIDTAGATGFATDQRGYPRPVGIAPDIGAVEVQSLVQNVIYDSLGFESPRFSLGSLVGQDGVNGPWLQTLGGSGTATVQNTNVAAGAQAVRVNRTGSDTRFAVVKTNLNVGSSVTPIIAVEWSMKYQAANLPSGSYGPLFGIEVYDDNGAFPSLAASATVDATTSELLYQTPGTGFLTTVPGITVPPNTWHSYRLELDYSSQTYRLIYDGMEVLTNGFVEADITDFTDAPIAAIAGAGDPTSQNASGTAFFDNYKITALSAGSQILSIRKAGAGQATLSWTPTPPGSILLETPSLSPANWTLSPSVSTNPVTVPTVANKFYRLYRP